MSVSDFTYSEVLNWLLEPESPGARYLALRDLCNLPANDPELRAARSAAHQQGPIATVMAAMQPEGYWEKPGPGYGPKYRSTVWALILLAQLGAHVEEDERIQRACDYLVAHALAPGGQFSYNGAPGGTIDCLQGNLCWALTELGYPFEKLETAYDWMARSVTGEGIAPKIDKKAEQRYYAYKCAPNFACGANDEQPCAWGAVKVMLAFGSWPVEKRTPPIEAAIQQGVDFLFSVNPVTAAYPVGKGNINSSWWKFGFPVFYITDILQIAEALAALGYAQDARLANTLAHIESKQDAQGRWALKYDYKSKTWGSYGKMGEPNKWVTLRALRVLQAAKV